MKIDFYICRHGQTDKNVEGVWQGSGTDVPLNETGQMQAKVLAEKLRFKMMDVYTSPLLRAVQTAEEITKTAVTTRRMIVMNDLRECSFGDAEGLSFKEAEQRYGEMVDKLLYPTEETANLRFPNGESKREVFERVQRCLRSIAERHFTYYAYHTVCVVCHAGVLSALQYGLKLKNVSFDNCSCMRLQFETRTRSFVPCID